VPDYGRTKISALLRERLVHASALERANLVTGQSSAFLATLSLYCFGVVGCDSGVRLTHTWNSRQLHRGNKRGHWL
jgi:hypothetical protein